MQQQQQQEIIKANDEQRIVLDGDVQQPQQPQQPQQVQRPPMQPQQVQQHPRQQVQRQSQQPQQPQRPPMQHQPGYPQPGYQSGNQPGQFIPNANILDLQFGMPLNPQSNFSQHSGGNSDMGNSGNSNELKKDLRQNLNSQIGSFIFDNLSSYNPPMIPRVADPFGLDNRVVVQERSKNLYKNETNERLAQLNPIGRAMSFPVDYDNNRPTNYLG